MKFTAGNCSIISFAKKFIGETQADDAINVCTTRCTQRDNRSAVVPTQARTQASLVKDLECHSLHTPTHMQLSLQ